MKTFIRIGLVGDYHPKVLAHHAIPKALAGAAGDLGIDVAFEWLPTEAVAAGAPSQFDRFDGIWCVPASPYRSEAGALQAIRACREEKRPFLGTCGGFQHAVLEYARNVLGLTHAAHAENDPDAPDPVIAALTCGLVEATGGIRIEPGSRLAGWYGATSADETYHCRYGLSPQFATLLLDGRMRVCARDAEGEVRAIELDGHPFFLATLFQPERAALAGRNHPLISAFVAAAAAS